MRNMNFSKAVNFEMYIPYKIGLSYYRLCRFISLLFFLMKGTNHNIITLDFVKVLNSSIDSMFLIVFGSNEIIYCYYSCYFEIFYRVILLLACGRIYFLGLLRDILRVIIFSVWGSFPNVEIFRMSPNFFREDNSRTRVAFRVFSVSSYS